MYKFNYTVIITINVNNTKQWDKSKVGVFCAMTHSPWAIAYGPRGFKYTVRMYESEKSLTKVTSPKRPKVDGLKSQNWTVFWMKVDGPFWKKVQIVIVFNQFFLYNMI